MPDFDFKLLGADQGVQSTCVMDADSDEDACEIAGDMLSVSEFNVIEVWQGSKLIFRIAKVDE